MTKNFITKLYSYTNKKYLSPDIFLKVNNNVYMDIYVAKLCEIEQRTLDSLNKNFFYSINYPIDYKYFVVNYISKEGMSVLAHKTNIHKISLKGQYEGYNKNELLTSKATKMKNLNKRLL